MATVIRWYEFWKNNSHVIYGHDARNGLQLSPWATGIDTGCYTDDKEARLTALVLGPDIPNEFFLTQRRKVGCRSDEDMTGKPSDRPGVLVVVPKIIR
tara:strand:+ start:230 stop:523 length:294 start_codon:yes stop_codon:yes gene_type:complete